MSNRLKLTVRRIVVSALAFTVLTACNRQQEPPTPIVIVVTVITNASPVPPTLAPVATETTAQTAQPPATPTSAPSTPLPTITQKPQRPTRTPVIIPIYSPTPLPPPPPSATPVPPPQITEWRGEYFNNVSLIGSTIQSIGSNCDVAVSSQVIIKGATSGSNVISTSLV